MGCPAGLLWRIGYAVGCIHVSAASSTESVARSELTSLSALRGCLWSPPKRSKSAVLGNIVNHLDAYSCVIRFPCFPLKTRVKVVSLTNPRLAQMGRIGLRGTHPSSGKPDYVVFVYGSDHERFIKRLGTERGEARIGACSGRKPIPRRTHPSFQRLSSTAANHLTSAPPRKRPRSLKSSFPA